MDCYNMMMMLMMMWSVSYFWLVMLRVACIYQHIYMCLCWLTCSYSATLYCACVRAYGRIRADKNTTFFFILISCGCALHFEYYDDFFFIIRSEVLLNFQHFHVWGFCNVDAKVYSKNIWQVSVLCVRKECDYIILL